MNLSAIFIKRPVTTTLIMPGILVSGVMAYRLLASVQYAARRPTDTDRATAIG